MRKILLLILSLSGSLLHSQENPNKNPSIQEQFEFIYKISNNYKYFKVIEKSRFDELKKNTLDSLNFQKGKAINLQNKLNTVSSSTENLKNTNQLLQNKLTEAIQKSKSVNFFGSTISISTYSLIVWLLIVILLVGMIYFIYKFLNNNHLTKESIANLKDVEKEFELHRKKALEREQKLRRQLHDEVNKNRDS